MAPIMGFYLNIGEKNYSSIGLKSSLSVELEVFDKLALDKSEVAKVASKENYKLCDLDKIYLDIFLCLK